MVAGVAAFLIAFACAVGALVRREENRGRSEVAPDGVRAAKPDRAERARARDERKQAARARAERDRTARAEAAKARRAQERSHQPPPAPKPVAEADPALVLYLRDDAGPR
jgi:hypothetical protein